MKTIYRKIAISEQEILRAYAPDPLLEQNRQKARNEIANAIADDVEITEKKRMDNYSTELDGAVTIISQAERDALIHLCRVVSNFNADPHDTVVDAIEDLVLAVEENS